MSLEEKLVWASECHEEWPCMGVSWWQCRLLLVVYWCFCVPGEYSPPWTYSPRSIHHNDTDYEGPL
eukprot:6474737-Amphidinium_carterae.1